ncbi:MAG: endonuclease I [Parvicella sp.]|jgi:endonuclease I
MKHFLTFGFTFILILSQAQMPAYYNSIDFSNATSTVEANLKTLITTTHNPLDYSDTYPWMKVIDEDQSNVNNIILMYNAQSISKLQTIGGGNTSNPEVWNREHVYPQSMINTTAKGDLHHLRGCDGVINGNRGSLSFAAGSGSYGTVSGGWYPGDEWKGDVARMVFYVYLRYNEPIADIGNLSLLLQWNVDDPVSTFEQQRNGLIQNAQGNRNPFIDQPYLATFFFGGPDAEDLWGWPNDISEIDLTSVLAYPNPATNQINVSSSVELEKLELYDLIGNKVSATLNKNADKYTLDISQMSSGMYLLKIQSGEKFRTISIVKK